MVVGIAVDGLVKPSVRLDANFACFVVSGNIAKVLLESMFYARVLGSVLSLRQKKK